MRSPLLPLLFTSSYCRSTETRQRRPSSVGGQGEPSRIWKFPWGCVVTLSEFPRAQRAHGRQRWNLLTLRKHEIMQPKMAFFLFSFFLPWKAQWDMVNVQKGIGRSFTFFFKYVTYDTCLSFRKQSIRQEEGQPGWQLALGSKSKKLQGGNKLLEK